MVGLEGKYEVSDTGLVRNSKGLILNPEVAKSGHLRVGLYVSPRKPKHFQVHRLVAKAFIGESDLPVLHWDDIPDNNHVSNLRYGTHKENWWDAARNGRRRVEDYCPRGHDYPKNPDGTTRKRCFECELVVGKRRYWEQVSDGLNGSDERHGTYAGYRAGCRCTGCFAANRDYKREWARADRRSKR